MNKERVFFWSVVIIFIIALFVLCLDSFGQNGVLPDTMRVDFDLGSSEVKKCYLVKLDGLGQLLQSDPTLDYEVAVSVDSVYWITNIQKFKKVQDSLLIVSSHFWFDLRQVGVDSIGRKYELNDNFVSDTTSYYYKHYAPQGKKKVYRKKEEHDIFNAALLLSRPYAVFQIMNIPLELKKVNFVPSQKERFVKVIVSEKSNEIQVLSEALSAEIRNAQQADSVLFGRIKANQDMIKSAWGYLSEQFDHSISIGYEYVLIDRNEFWVPIIEYSSSQGLFGLEGHIGGMIADKINGQRTYNGVWGGLFFIRPFRFLKLGLGYKGISRFFESDLTWYNRHDCFWVNSELEIPLSSKWNFNLSFGGIKAEKWGSVIGFGSSINW